MSSEVYQALCLDSKGEKLYKFSITSSSQYFISIDFCQVNNSENAEFYAYSVY